VIGALPQKLLPRNGVGLAALEGGREGLERAVVHGDDIIATEEEIDFAGAGELVAGIPEREVHDEEEVVVVLVELGAFDGADDIFEVERVEVGIAGVEGFDVCGAGVDDVDPGDGAVLDDAGGHGGYFSHRGTEDTEGNTEDWPDLPRTGFGLPLRGSGGKRNWRFGKG